MDNVLAIKITSDSTTLPSPDPAVTSNTLAASADGWSKAAEGYNSTALNFNFKGKSEKLKCKNQMRKKPSRRPFPEVITNHGAGSLL